MTAAIHALFTVSHARAFNLLLTVADALSEMYIRVSDIRIPKSVADDVKF